MGGRGGEVGVVGTWCLLSGWSSRAPAGPPAGAVAGFLCLRHGCSAGASLRGSSHCCRASPLLQLGTPFSITLEAPHVVDMRRQASLAGCSLQPVAASGRGFGPACCKRSMR